MAESAAGVGGWPEGERPRERIERQGARGLTDAQLLAVLFGTGGGPCGTALDLARGLLGSFPSLAEIDRASFRELTGVAGLGPAKTARVKAALELGKRLAAFRHRPRARFSGSREVASYFSPRLAHEAREVFVAVLLNARNEIIREVTVSVGTLTSSLVHPREVFQPAVRDSAAAMILVHNHPSGDPAPSSEDVALTRRLVDVGKTLGIAVLDHVIVAAGGFVSLMQEEARRPH